MGQQPGGRDEENPRDCAKLQLHRNGKCLVLDLFEGIIEGIGACDNWTKRFFYNVSDSAVVLEQEVISLVPYQTKVAVNW